jgi:alkane 1-monooxygenase
MRHDVKYLIAYLAPLAGFWGVYAGGWWSLGSIYIAFVMIPLLEPFLPGSDRNLSPDEEKAKLSVRFFDWLLYLNVPLLYGLLIFFFHTLVNRDLTGGEMLGMTLNVGLVVGTIGINVAHELGHRSNKREQFLAKTLLLSALYMHFFIEHNRGHHKHVATPKDPATSRFNESIYAFWWRSVTGSYRHAWALEKRRLEALDVSPWSWQNEMVRFQVVQVMYLIGVGLIWGPTVACFAIGTAIVGFLLLESVNYIEHYGLVRKQLASGRYEPVTPRHSWNSNHELGRIFLYELTRHSDHHYKATRKYQVLRHMDESPQLPLGYPTSILMALVPPLWFKKMNPIVEAVGE